MFSGLVDVQITHFEVDTSQVDQPVECTADLPIIETEIPLGIASDLEAGYTVKVNGQISAEFLVRDPEGPKMTVALASWRSIASCPGRSPAPARPCSAPTTSMLGVELPKRD